MGLLSTQKTGATLQEAIAAIMTPEVSPATIPGESNRDPSDRARGVSKVLMQNRLLTRTRDENPMIDVLPRPRVLSRVRGVAKLGDCV